MPFAARRLVEFESAGLTLCGVFDEPAAAPVGGKRPGVMFCHGFTGHRIESKRLFVRLAGELVKHGFICFRFDHRGCGESEGDFINFTVDGYLSDLRAARETFLQHPALSTELGLVGYSLGGGTSLPYLLNLFPDTFRAGVSWAPLSYPAALVARLAADPKWETHQAQGFYDYNGFRISPDFLQGCTRRLTPLEWMTTAPKIPVQFLVGENDPITPPNHASDLMLAHQHERDSFHMIPGVDHGFGGSESLECLLRMSADWLRDHLQNR